MDHGAAAEPPSAYAPDECVHGGRRNPEARYPTQTPEPAVIDATIGKSGVQNGPGQRSEGRAGTSAETAP